MRLFSMTAAAGLVMAGSVALPAAPAQAQQWREVKCESWNYREARCPIPNANRVQLLRVDGGTCIEGQTWYHDRNAIVVRNGCRATFRYDNNDGWGLGGWDPNLGNNWNNGQRQMVRCESWNYRDQRCQVNGNVRSVRLMRVIAGDCRDGQTFRWNRNAIFVRNGCRADFEVLLGYNGWQGGNQGGGWGGGQVDPDFGVGRPAQTITCESWNYRSARCAVPRPNGVRLNRVLGGTCVQDRTWGWDRRGVWVNGGCRATFDVY